MDCPSSAKNNISVKHKWCISLSVNSLIYRIGIWVTHPPHRMQRYLRSTQRLRNIVLWLWFWLDFLPQRIKWHNTVLAAKCQPMCHLPYRLRERFLKETDFLWCKVKHLCFSRYSDDCKKKKIKVTGIEQKLFLESLKGLMEC